MHQYAPIRPFTAARVRFPYGTPILFRAELNVEVRLFKAYLLSPLVSSAPTATVNG